MIPPEVQPLTLGDLLYTGNGQTLIFEHTWVDLVRSIAARDQLALHGLYMRTHGVVFTWIAQIARDWEAAEDLTLDVFDDVWRTVTGGRKRNPCSFMSAASRSGMPSGAH